MKRLTDKQIKFLNSTIPYGLYRQYNHKDFLLRILFNEEYNDEDAKRLNQLRYEYLIFLKNK